MTSRSRFRSVQLERCSQIFYEPMLKNGLIVESKKSGMLKSTGASDTALLHTYGTSNFQNGCCCPTTSTSPTMVDNVSNSITVVSGSKSRGIVHSITESGKARLLFEDNFSRLKGVLLNQYEESISITGTAAFKDSKLDPIMALNESMPSSVSVGNMPLLAEIAANEAAATEGNNGDSSQQQHHTNTVCRTMNFTIVDGEVGQTFYLENVEMEITARLVVTPPSPTSHWPAFEMDAMKPKLSTSSIGATSTQPQLTVEIKHPAIRFRTEDVFIGNRAEIEIRKYLGGWGSTEGRLTRMHSRSGSHHHSQQNSHLHSPSAAPLQHASHASMAGSALYVGPMALNVVSMERTAPSMRRVSTCDGCTTNIIEQANDFLV